MANTGLLHPGDIIQKPDQFTWVVLATGTTNAQAFDVPTGKNVAAFSFNSDVWVTYGSTSGGIPTTSSTAGTAELNPGVRFLVSTVQCTGVSLAAEVATKGCITWYAR